MSSFHFPAYKIQYMKAIDFCRRRINSIWLAPVILLLPCMVFSQNIGIGLSNPTRARLELNGAVSTTAAIFGGESTGISLQRNWPAVGFNQYFNGTGKYMANGYGGAIALDPAAGYMIFDMYPYGSANGDIPF